MFDLFVSIKKITLAIFMAFGLATTTIAAHSVAAPTSAEAGVIKKAKKGLKLIGKGAKKLEKKMAKKGNLGKVISKGARGVRKGANKASKGISKAQKKAGKAFKKVCKRNCQKVVKVGNKVRKGLNKLKREAQRKCEQYGRNSKVCRAARNALELASPI